MFGHTDTIGLEMNAFRAFGRKSINYYFLNFLDSQKIFISNIGNKIVGVNSLSLIIIFLIFIYISFVLK